MKKSGLLHLIFLILLQIQSINAQQSRSLTNEPATISKFIVDETNTLTQSQINSLLYKLTEFEKETSNQLVVYLIPDLNGEPIEDVSMSIVEKNQIGQKGKDNGILLLVAKNERKLRIEVGYGLEGALPDATASNIIRNVIVPEFRQDNYYSGIDKGVDAIISATKGEYTASKNPEKIDIPFLIFVVLIVGFFFIIFIVGLIKNIAGYGTSYVSGKRGSGYHGGFWGSGGGSSSGSSFGSFSGGGGSFGGGGASGSW